MARLSAGDKAWSTQNGSLATSMPPLSGNGEAAAAALTERRLPTLLVDEPPLRSLCNSTARAFHRAPAAPGSRGSACPCGLPPAPRRSPPPPCGLPLPSTGTLAAVAVVGEATCSAAADAADAMTGGAKKSHSTASSAKDRIEPRELGRPNPRWDRRAPPPPPPSLTFDGSLESS
jgi:hypothetical protein